MELSLFTSFLNLFMWDTNSSEDLDSSFDIDRALHDNWKKIDSKMKEINEGKVDKVSGKGLSTKDFTTAYENKLKGIETGAQLNVLEGLTLGGKTLNISGKKIEIKDTEVTNARESKTKGKTFNDVDARLEEIEDDINNISKTRGHIYGIRRKISNNTSSNWERVEDSIGLVANATKNGGEVANDFDNLSPWKDIVSFNLDLETGKKKAYFGDADFKFDGSNGDVYTHIPTFWLKIYEENDYMYILIADYERSGFIKIKEFDIQRYLTGIGEDGKLHSYSGLAGADFKNINQYRTLVKNLGDDYCLMDWRYFAIQCLYLVEYATYNSQSALGNGMASMRHNNGDVALLAETNTNRFVVNTGAGNQFIVGQQVRIGAYDNFPSVIRTITAINNYEDSNITGKEIVLDGDPIANISLTTYIWTCVQNSGGCDSLGMKSGCLVNDGKHNVIYRGIESIIGNIFSFVDGINIKDCVAYVCYNPKEYVSDKFESPYEKIGYINSKQEGYCKALGFDINHPLIQLPTEIGANSTSGTTDYYWCTATGNRVARVGGYSNNGANDGLWSWVLNTTSSNSNWNCGARVLKYQ
ncbi:MAG: hypothetical protein KIC60_05985 [Clostridium sp.]|nr:hypothetical protein [Clostridium sp.]